MSHINRKVTTLLSLLVLTLGPYTYSAYASVPEPIATEQKISTPSSTALRDNVVNAFQSYRNASSQDEAKLKTALERTILERYTYLLAQIQTKPDSLTTAILPTEILNLIPQSLSNYLEHPVNNMGGWLERSHQDTESHSGVVPKNILLFRTPSQTYQVANADLFRDMPDISHASIQSGLVFAGYIITTPSQLRFPEESPDTTIRPHKKKVGVIVLNFENNQTQPKSIAEIKDLVFTGNKSVREYFREETFGKWDFTGVQNTDGDVFGYYTVPYDNLTCIAYHNWFQAADAAAIRDGFVRSNYDNLIYLFSAPSCNSSWAGRKLPGVPGESIVSFLHGTTASLEGHIAHEFGHTYGLPHAQKYICPNGDFYTNRGCTYYEYGDSFDVMGNGFGNPAGPALHTNMRHKAMLLATDENSVQTVTTSGEYTIYPLERGTSKTQLLQIPRPGMFTLPGFEFIAPERMFYYVDLRKRIGFDAPLPGKEIDKGVLIHLSEGIVNRLYNTNYNTALINTSDDIPAAPYTVGEAFQDNIGKITIEPIEITDQYARVRVTFGTNWLKCTPIAPLLELSPETQTTVPYGRGFYSLIIHDQNSIGCPEKQWNLSPRDFGNLVPCWSSFSLAIMPQQNLTVPFCISVPPSTPPGRYKFSLEATSAYASRDGLPALVNGTIIVQ